MMVMNVMMFLAGVVGEERVALDGETGDHPADDRGSKDETVADPAGAEPLRGVAASIAPEGAGGGGTA